MRKIMLKQKFLFKLLCPCVSGMNTKPNKSKMAGRNKGKVSFSAASVWKIFARCFFRLPLVRSTANEFLCLAAAALIMRSQAPFISGQPHLREILFIRLMAFFIEVLSIRRHDTNSRCSIRREGFGER